MTWPHLSTQDDAERFYRAVAVFVDNYGYSSPGNLAAEFSVTPCDCCGRDLAGARWSVFDREGESMAEICIDCLHYLVNGELDCQSRLEIEKSKEGPNT